MLEDDRRRLTSGGSEIIKAVRERRAARSAKLPNVRHRATSLLAAYPSASSRHLGRVTTYRHTIRLDRRQAVSGLPDVRDGGQPGADAGQRCPLSKRRFVVHRSPADLSPAGHRPIVIVGRGRLGRSLADALGVPLFSGHAPERLPADCLCILCVSDPAISNVADSLVGQPFAVVHTSGAFGLEVLRRAHDRWHEVGAFHPLQSFPAPRSAAAFSGTMFAIDASSTELMGELEALAHRLGGWPKRIAGQSQRVRYHATATFAGPLLVALISGAVQILEDVGLTRDEAIDGVVAFVRGTAENVASLRLPGAFIGPMRRGDIEMLQRHLASLTEPQLGAYKALSRMALDLAQDSGVDQTAVTRMREILIR